MGDKGENNIEPGGSGALMAWRDLKAVFFGAAMPSCPSTESLGCAIGAGSRADTMYSIAFLSNGVSDKSRNSNVSV